MPPDRGSPNDAGEWLARARSNLVRASLKVPGVYLEDLCFDAQQAAEKALKAVCIRFRMAFPRTHNLAELITLLEEDGTPFPEELVPVSRLTRYAVHARYPAFAEAPTDDDHAVAVDLAERVGAWAAALIERA